jgi:hypothetical protein
LERIVEACKEETKVEPTFVVVDAIIEEHPTDNPMMDDATKVDN